jgi:hypothetical protein
MGKECCCFRDLDHLHGHTSRKKLAEGIVLIPKSKELEFSVGERKGNKRVFFLLTLFAKKSGKIINCHRGEAKREKELSLHLSHIPD